MTGADNNRGRNRLLAEEDAFWRWLHASSTPKLGEWAGGWRG